jgi:uncharacterized membrane protein
MSDLTAFVTWYIAATVCGALALPLAFKFFGFLPERGYTFARPLGLLATGYVFWLLGSLGFLRNDAPSILIAGALVLGVGVYLLKGPGLAELWAWLMENRALALGVEAVFFAAFALWAYVRAYNPDIAFTEKPMEFMFINSILRSPAFPPRDAWLSGHAISYYYFGYVLVAMLTKVTGVASSVAFNLGLALLFALTAAGALGVGVNLIALATPIPNPSPVRVAKRSERRASGARVGVAFWPALLAPVMILLAGNLYGVLKIAHLNKLFADLQIPAVRYDFGVRREPGARPQTLADFVELPGVRVDLINVWTWLDLKGLNAPPSGPGPEAFVWGTHDWWADSFNSARVTHDRDLVGEETEAITEMPAFSFVLGDMHPHVLALPFVFLAIALALNWLLWALNSPLPEGRSGTGLGVRAILQPLIPNLLFTALILGGLSFLNTWDFPIYLFVVVAALTAGLGVAWGWETLLRRWTIPAAFAMALALLGVGLYLPFYFTFQSQAGGLLPNLIYPTRFQQTFVMFGHILIGAVLFLGWLAVRERAALDRRAALWAGGGILAALILVTLAMSIAAWFNPNLYAFASEAVAPFTLEEAMGLMLQRRLVDSLTSLLPAVMIGLTVGLGVSAMRRLPSPSGTIAPEAKRSGGGAGGEGEHSLLHSPALLMSLVMLLTGALLLLGPEFVYLRDLFGSRMNTIFKFYFQTWVLWGLAGAFGLWYIAQYARRAAWMSMAAVTTLAIAGGLVYTLTSTCTKAAPLCDSAARQASPAQPTLDGMAYFARQYPDDWAAIQWLEDNVDGTPVMAEGIGGQYWIEGRFSRISMATGLPTVMGWPGHESQWRGRYFDENLTGREGDVQRLYQARDWQTAKPLLDQYDIQYVVVSGLERQKYGAVRQEKFDQFMRPVFQAGDVTIYQRLDGE